METKHVYDERGYRYDIPMYVFEDPKNLITESLIEEGKEKESSSQNNVVKNINIRVRLSVGGDININISDTNSINELKSMLQQKINVDPLHIRIIFKGKELQNHYRINKPYPIKNDAIIHATFHSKYYNKNNKNDETKDDEQLSLKQELNTELVLKKDELSMKNT